MKSLEARLPKSVTAYAASMYAGLTLLVFLIYHLLSDGDFSFLLTLAGLLRLFAFALLLLHVVLDKTTAGLSAKSLSLFAMAFLSRFVCVSSFPGYLPLDHSGDYIPHIEMLSFLLACVVLGLCLSKFRSTYAMEEDRFGKGVVPGVPHQVGPLYLALPCLLMALLLHPNLNNHFSTDVAWTFSMYVETVAVIPQLVMFQKSNKPVERWTGHFVFTLGASRLLSFIFWVSSYHELGDRGKTAWVGYFVVVTEVLALAVLADYSYFWLQSQRSGVALNLSV